MSVRLLRSLVVVICVASQAQSQTVDTIRAAATIGCYRVTPAFTYSAFGAPDGADTTWAVLRLFADSIARRPLRRRDYDVQSRWWFDADTLVVRVQDLVGVGWLARFVAVGDEWKGKARYLTDVIGGEPLFRDFVLTRRLCSGLPNGGL
jgi:hypothetical protein